MEVDGAVLCGGGKDGATSSVEGLPEPSRQHKSLGSRVSYEQPQTVEAGVGFPVQFQGGAAGLCPF